MAIDKLAFDPDNGFLDITKYPDPVSEMDCRTQFMTLHNQTRDYLNDKLIHELASTSGAADIGAEDGNTVQKNLDAKIIFDTSTAKHLRVNPSTNTLQYSPDGITWSDLAAERPSVYDNSNVYPDRPKWKFVNASIAYTDEYLVITAAKGDKGDAGKDGNNFVIKDYYATLVDLQAAHPTGTTGDAYAIGSSGTYVIYIWSASTSTWVSLGAGIVGPKGDTGEKGDAGATGAGVAAGGTAGQIMCKKTDADYDTKWEDFPNTATWGKIGGTLSNQTDLNSVITSINNSITALGTFEPIYKSAVQIATGNIASSSTYTAYPYRSTLQGWAGITASYEPNASIDPANAYTGNFMIETATDGFYVYFASMPTAAVVFSFISMAKRVSA